MPPFYTSGKRVENGTFIRGQKSFSQYRWSFGRGPGSEGCLLLIEKGRSAGYSWRIRMRKECTLQKYHEAFAAKCQDQRGQYPVLTGRTLPVIREKEMQKLRGKIFSMIFQDPMTSLNPTIKIGKQIAEAVLIHNKKYTKEQADQKVLELMELVGISHPKERYHQYPWQFSGGMRQRCVMAIALAADPDILFADEPTTALDVTIQAQILDLLREIQMKLGTATILVSHDLGVVARVADRVAVMYAGKIVEIGTAEEVYYDPRHPYTWGLMRSLPAFAKGKESLYTIPGMPPTLINPPKGDAFACRNEYALNIDYEEMPPMFKITDTHYAATWLLDPRAPQIKSPMGGQCSE